MRQGRDETMEELRQRHVYFEPWVHYALQLPHLH